MNVRRPSLLSAATCIAASLVLAPVALSESAATSKATPVEASKRIALTFDWPEKGSVKIHSYAKKRGMEAEIDYVMTIVPDGESGGFLLETGGVDIRKVNGLSGEELLKDPKASQLALIAAALPAARIDAKGTLTGFSGLEAALENMSRLAPDEQGRKAMKELLAAPEMRQVLERKLAESWNLWVGAWIDLELAVGEEAAVDLEEPSFGGATVPTRYVFRCLSREEHLGRDCVRLSVDQTVDPVAFAKAMTAMMKSGGAPVPEVASAERTTHSEVVLEVATMRPHSASTAMTVTVKAPGETPLVQEELKRYELAWPDLAAPAAP